MGTRSDAQVLRTTERLTSGSCLVSIKVRENRKTFHFEEITTFGINELKGMEKGEYFRNHQK